MANYGTLGYRQKVTILLEHTVLTESVYSSKSLYIVMFQMNVQFLSLELKCDMSSNSAIIPMQVNTVIGQTM